MLFLFVHYLFALNGNSIDNLRKKFVTSGGILYKEGVLPQDDLQTIRTEVDALSSSFSPERSSVASLRTGAVLTSESSTFRIVSDKNGAFHRIVNRIMKSFDDDKEYELSEVVPLEVRRYGSVGSGMAWHKDDVLFDPCQIEIVFTLDNNSNCRTMWKENLPKNQESDDEQTKIYEVETEPNSAIFLQAGGVEHCVSSLKVGERTILKFAFVRRGSQVREDAKAVLGQFMSKNSLG